MLRVPARMGQPALPSPGVERRRGWLCLSGWYGLPNSSVTSAVPQPVSGACWISQCAIIRTGRACDSWQKKKNDRSEKRRWGSCFWSQWPWGLRLSGGGSRPTHSYPAKGRDVFRSVVIGASVAIGTHLVLAACAPPHGATGTCLEGPDQVSAQAAGDACGGAGVGGGVASRNPHNRLTLTDRTCQSVP